jgi:uncharacterized membrane protein YgdD (TMEM256/DUF423 family)
MKDKNLLTAACIAGFLAVALGAFGAHGLKPYLNDYQRTIFEKGVSYQFYHALAAMLACVLFEFRKQQILLLAATCFIVGIVFFSGSLYLLATADMTGFPKGIAGPMTPAGGLAFLAGWAVLVISSFKNSSVPNI